MTFSRSLGLWAVANCEVRGTATSIKVTHLQLPIKRRGLRREGGRGRTRGRKRRGEGVLTLVGMAVLVSTIAPLGLVWGSSVPLPLPEEEEEEEEEVVGPW